MTPLEVLENSLYNISNYKKTGLHALLDLAKEQLATGIKALKKGCPAYSDSPTEIIVQVSGGMIDVTQKPAGIGVTLVDYDTEGIDMDPGEVDSEENPRSVDRIDFMADIRLQDGFSYNLDERTDIPSKDKLDFKQEE